MGYRSDVGALFYVSGQGYKDRYSALKLFFDENFPFEDWEGCIEEFKDSFVGGFKFFVEDCKWYEDHKDVKRFNSFVSRYLEVGNTLRWHYEFIRMGEDNDDVETEVPKNEAPMMYISRSICFDV